VAVCEFPAWDPRPSVWAALCVPCGPLSVLFPATHTLRVVSRVNPAAVLSHSDGCSTCGVNSRNQHTYRYKYLYIYIYTIYVGISLDVLACGATATAYIHIQIQREREILSIYVYLFMYIAWGATAIGCANLNVVLR